jgi:hypothetical protein
VGKAEEKMSQLAQQLELEAAARSDSEQQCEQLGLQAAAASSQAEALQQHAKHLDAALQELRQQEAHGSRLVEQQEDSIVALQEQLGGLLGAMISFADELERVAPPPLRYLLVDVARGARALHDSGAWGRRLQGVLEMIRLAGQQLQETALQVGGAAAGAEPGPALRCAVLHGAPRRDARLAHACACARRAACCRADAASAPARPRRAAAAAAGGAALQPPGPGRGAAPAAGRGL